MATVPKVKALVSVTAVAPPLKSTAPVKSFWLRVRVMVPVPAWTTVVELASMRPPVCDTLPAVLVSDRAPLAWI